MLPRTNFQRKEESAEGATLTTEGQVFERNTSEVMGRLVIIEWVVFHPLGNIPTSSLY